MVVNKPAGLSSESGYAAHPSMEKAVLAYLMERTRQIPGVDKFYKAPYLRAVHRLDRPASGIMVFAKNKSTLTELMRQFEAGTVLKTYLAQTVHPPAEETATLHHYIRKDETGKLAIVSDRPSIDAKPCSLTYQILGSLGGETRLQVQPHTGKFHQIRAQLAFIGCPIVGDIQYGADLWRDFEIKLHAHALNFIHPFTRKNLQFLLDPPNHW